MKSGTISIILSLTKIAIDLQQNVNSDEFEGNLNLQEISLPLMKH